MPALDSYNVMYIVQCGSCYISQFLKYCNRSTEFIWVIIMNIQKELIKNMDVV